MYNVAIADVALLENEEVQRVSFISSTPGGSDARSSSIGATLTIMGRIAYDSDKVHMRNAAQKIAAWSMVKPDSEDTYKEVVVEFMHNTEMRKYTFSHAFVISYSEQFEDQNGFFELVVRQKKDRLDGVKVE